MTAGMSALHRALTDPGLRPLPERVSLLLRELDAPPRLAAHLRAVHDVAAGLKAGSHSGTESTA